MPTATLLTADNTTTDGTSASTASISPADDALVLVFVALTRDAALPSDPTLSGGGMAAWDLVASQTYITGEPHQGRLCLFRAREATPGTAALTITGAGGTESLSSFAWSVIQVTDVDTSGTNGSGALGTPGVNEATSSATTAFSVTVGATPASNSLVIGGVATNQNTSAVVPDAGVTELTEQTWSNPTNGHQSQWAEGTVGATCGWTFSVGSRAAGIAVEVKAPEAVAAAAWQVWDGSAWVDATVQLWDGSAWVSA